MQMMVSGWHRANLKNSHSYVIMWIVCVRIPQALIMVKAIGQFSLGNLSALVSQRTIQLLEGREKQRVNCIIGWLEALLSSFRVPRGTS